MPNAATGCSHERDAPRVRSGGNSRDQNASARAPAPADTPRGADPLYPGHAASACAAVTGSTVAPARRSTATATAAPTGTTADAASAAASRPAPPRTRGSSVVADHQPRPPARATRATRAAVATTESTSAAEPVGGSVRSARPRHRTPGSCGAGAFAVEAVVDDRRCSGRGGGGDRRRRGSAPQRAERRGDLVGGPVTGAHGSVHETGPLVGGFGAGPVQWTDRGAQ